MRKLCWMLMLMVSATPVWAQTAEERGLEIAKEVETRNEGWGDFQAEMVMTLRNRQGEESVRYIRVKTLEVLDDGDKSLTIFDEPADVKGTAMLTHSHAIESDDQWLYLPALKRVKRIASKNKSGPFMGSEFAFEDLSSQDLEKFTYKYLGDDACGEETCFILERVPAYKFSGYTRQVAWIDQSEYRAVKVEFYDRKNALLKTLESADYKQYLGQYWRPGKMEMTNHQTGKSTSILWKDYQFGVGLSDREFNQASLKRAR